jgi:signal transduction histidine kinase
MGGSIGVESRPGGGSSFSFTLPLATPVPARPLAEVQA